MVLYIPLLSCNMYVIQGASRDRFGDSQYLETILHQRNNTRAPRNNVVRLTNTSENSLKLRSSRTSARNKFEVSIERTRFTA